MTSPPSLVKVRTMTVPLLLAKIPEITPGGKLIVGFWTVWVAAMFIGFLWKAFRTDDLEIVEVPQQHDEPQHH